MERDVYPKELFVGCEDAVERTARMGRLDVLDELGYFGEESNVRLARNERAGSWIAEVRKKFSGIYQNTDGCSAGDIENAALYVGRFDDIFDVEATSNAAKYLADR